MVSSLCSRTRPTSLNPTERILPRITWRASLAAVFLESSRQQPLVFGLRGALLRRTGDGAQSQSHFGTGHVTIVRRFGQGAVDDGFDLRRQVGANHANRCMRLGGD